MYGIGFLIFRAVKSVNYNKNAKNPVVTLEVEGYGEIKIELEPDYAPNTVATIVHLVNNGYYDGKIFYGTDSKVVAGGMELKTEEITSDQYDEEGNYIGPEGEEKTTKISAEEDKLRVSDLDKTVLPYISESDEKYEETPEAQRGDEKTDYKISINGEFVANGFNSNTLRFEKGTVGLYRSTYDAENLNKESYNSGTSLFFIATDEDSALNGEYAAFGRVIKGMDIVEKMLTLPLAEDVVDENGNTKEDASAGNLSENKEITKFANDSFPVITKATVETYGVSYDMPEYEEAFDYNQYLSDLILQYYRNQ